MLVQACLNGSRDAAFHTGVPLAPGEIATDALRCVTAGAAEIHVHPRGADGAESLSSSVVGQAVTALRRVCPGTLIGLSTAACIEGDAGRTLSAIAGWTCLPDYASVNLSEPDAPAVVDLLNRMGIGVEAGLSSVEDAERLVRLQSARPAFRVLLESVEQDAKAARTTNEGIVRVLLAAGVARPILLHGFDLTVWQMVEAAGRALYATRVGFEDGKLLPDGSIARSNAELVATALLRMRSSAVGAEGIEGDSSTYCAA